MGIPSSTDENPNPNQPPGWATGALRSCSRPRLRLLRRDEDRPERRRHVGFLRQLTTDLGEVVAAGHRLDLPGVAVEPRRRIAALVFGVPQVAGVEDVLVAEPLAQFVGFGAALLVCLAGRLVEGEVLDAGPAARCAERVDIGEQPVLGLTRQ